MSKVDFQELLDSGVHFGHLKRKWNPNMAPYIFAEKKGIHIIDLNKTIAHLEQASAAVKQIAKSGKKILFVATKKQAKEIISERAKSVNMPFVVERWTGGMLTNFATTRKSIRKMTSIDKMKVDGTWETLSKRERLFKTRQREKLEKNFGSIADMTRLPAAIFVIDVLKESITVKEAKRLNIPTFAMVDTNSDPRVVDFPIPANDDATKSIAKIMDVIIASVVEGLEERKASKDKSSKEDDNDDAETVDVEVTAEKAPKEAKKEKAPVAEAEEVEVAEVEAPKEEKKAPAKKAPATEAKKAPAKKAPAKKTPVAKAEEGK